MYYKGNDGDYAYCAAGSTTRIYVVHRPKTDAGELQAPDTRTALSHSVGIKRQSKPPMYSDDQGE